MSRRMHYTDESYDEGNQPARPCQFASPDKLVRKASANQSQVELTRFAGMVCLSYHIGLSLLPLRFSLPSA